MFWTTSLAGGLTLAPCQEGTQPWEFDLDAVTAALGEPTVKGLMVDKKTRSIYMTDPKTQWHIYVAGEGMDPTRRSSKENPVVKVHAFVADYDTPLEEAHVTTMEKLKMAPNWVEQSLSGNFRAVWLFESPVGVVNSAQARQFLTELGGLIKVTKVAPGFDKNSFNPSQTWTNGGRWLKLGDKPLPADLLHGLVIASMKGLNTPDAIDGVVTDLKAMSEALAKKFPRFADWPGELTLESQGPSFWIEGSSSPKSAIVKPWGMFTFAEGAAKSAFSWAELVGKDVADIIVSKKMSDAASEIYFDGLKYFIRTSPVTWSGYGVDPIKRHLKIVHGVSGVVGPDGFSQLDEALHAAESLNRVAAVAPCIPYSPGIVEVHGKRFLNDWVDLSVQPAEVGGATWGDGFPHIAEHIQHLFTHPECPDEPQYLRFVDWLSVFYRSIHLRQPQSGQAIFVLGGTGVGKGMLSGIIQAVVGGGTRAEEFLTGRSSFGGECYDQPLMCVDDLAGLESRKEVIKFTENIKARVANAFGQNYHKKHQTPANIPWFGRIVVTMNDDDNSMSVLPDFSSSVEDKINLYHAAPTKSEFADSQISLQSKREIIRTEAPAFARYLLNHYDAMKPARRDSRFGSKAYHFPSLRAEVNDTQALGTMAEPLFEYMTDWFAANPNHPAWVGRAAQLFREMQASGVIGAGSAYPGANVTKLGRQLRREESRGGGTCKATRYLGSNNSATWTIKREFLTNENGSKS
jgi:hypothetical protein